MTLLVGQKAPEFTSPALMADNTIEESFSLAAHIEGRFGVLVFYPMDFAFVCPTELIALNRRLGQFEARHARIVAVSGDSFLSHLKWKQTPEAEGGIGNVGFPLVADSTRRVARGYDVLVNDAMALRATFIIDPQGFVRYQAVNDLPVGRNIDELLRIIDGLGYYHETGKLCPAGWQPGQDGIVPDQAGMSRYMNAFGDLL